MVDRRICAWSAELKIVPLFSLFVSLHKTAIAASCAALFFFAFLFELIKWARVVLEQRSRASPSLDTSPVYASFSIPELGHFPSNPHNSPLSRRYGQSLSGATHLAQTGLFFVQLLLSYLLMLAVMTFSVWILLAVSAGAALGFWLFGRRQPVLVAPGGTASTGTAELH